MEKLKKLRLKRRLPQQKSKIATEHCKEEASSELETVVLSSDSEQGEANQLCKQRKCTEQRLPSEEIGFLQTSNPSLNKLREMILTLTPRDVNISQLSAFPAFSSQGEENTGYRLERKVILFQGGLQPLSKEQRAGDLSPFPKLSKHYKRNPKERKTENCHINEHTESAYSTEPEEKYVTDIHTSRISPNPSDSSLCGTGSSSDFKQHKQSAESGPTENKTHNSRKIQRFSASELSPENSAVIRDRNSNLYALQSQNPHITPASRHSVTSVPSTGKAELCGNTNDFTISEQKGRLSERVLTDIPNSKSSGGKDGGTLKNCPLCQMTFDARSGQMDIDSHIASCLSTSEDDVMW